MAILKIHPAEARLKAFSTCGFHLTVVFIYYGTAIFMYMCPQSQSSQDEDKITSVLYGAVIPMLNPLIYTLKNKDVERCPNEGGQRKDNRLMAAGILSSILSNESPVLCFFTIVHKIELNKRWTYLWPNLMEVSCCQKTLFRDSFIFKNIDPEDGSIVHEFIFHWL